MIFESQKLSLKLLSDFSKCDRHSILISGISGCGKTYLAKEYASMLKIPTFNVISPKVSSLKELIDDSYKLSDKQVICIEDLDKGMNSASQVILKYLEEPLPNVYVIVTCINSATLPSTILSRTLQIRVEDPHRHDLEVYAEFLNSKKFEILKNYKLWDIAKSFNDVKNMLDFSVDQFQYYDSIADLNFWKSSSDQIMWNLSHYPDNSKSNLVYSLKMMQMIKGADTAYLKVSKINSASLSSLLALELGRFSETAILGKLVLDCKVG